VTKRKKTFNKSWLEGSVDSLPLSSSILIESCRRILSDKTEKEVRQIAHETENSLELFKHQIRLGNDFVKHSRTIDKEEKRNWRKLEKIALSNDLFYFFDMHRKIAHGDSLINKYSYNEIFASMALYEMGAKNLLGAFMWGFLVHNFMLFEYKDSKESDEMRKIYDTGTRTLKAMEKGRIASAKSRSTKSYLQKKQWIELAINKWEINPGWTNQDMAEFIKEKTNSDYSIGTIVNAIKGKKTALHSRKNK